MIQFRSPNPASLLLILSLLWCGLVTIPQQLPVGPITGGGVATFVITFSAIVLWFRRPSFPRDYFRALLPLVLLLAYAAASTLWYPSGSKGLQLYSVMLGFFVLILLAARQVREDPSLPDRLYRAFDQATLMAAVIYAASVPIYGMGAEAFILARPLGLFLMAGIARQIALWQAGKSSGLLAACALTSLEFLCESRIGLGAALFLFAFAPCVRGDRRSIARSVAMTLAGAGAMLAAIYLSETMYTRFFGYDATLQVGGVYINGSGRAEMWAVLWESIKLAPVFGHGLASSSHLIDRHFAPGLGHPHNDFLRLWHDYGAVGLLCWLAFLGALSFRLCRYAHRLAVARHADLPLLLTPLLALVAAAISMTTDNSISYGFVMLPLGILIGCGLGRINVCVERRAYPRAAEFVPYIRHRVAKARSAVPAGDPWYRSHQPTGRPPRDMNN